jgi:hypothetical protein
MALKSSFGGEELLDTVVTERLKAVVLGRVLGHFRLLNLQTAQCVFDKHRLSLEE